MNDELELLEKPCLAKEIILSYLNRWEFKEYVH